MSEPAYRIELGLLGFAHFHQEHWVKVFLADPRVRIVGAWDDDPRILERAAREHGLKAFARPEELLANCRAAAICSETADHPRLVELCCRLGVDVLCEKPAAVDLAGARGMKRAIEAAGIRYYQSFPQRHVPSNLRIKEILDSGSLGRISHVRKRHGHPFALVDLKEKMPWIMDPLKAGGGALLDEGVHETDVLRWFFGDPLSVSAELAHGGGYSVESSGVALFRFPGEMLCVLEAGWDWHAGGPTTEIYGDRGVLIQSGSDCASNAGGGLCPQLSIYDAAAKAWRREDFQWDFSGIHRAAPRDFIDMLAGGGEPRSGIGDGLRASEMIEGAYASSREHRSIGFPLE